MMIDVSRKRGLIVRTCMYILTFNETPPRDTLCVTEKKLVLIRHKIYKWYNKM